MTRLRMLPTETFGDSENRDSIVLVPEDLQSEFPPRFDEKYPGKALWSDLLVSPSQISTYTACARKWGWNKLDGQKEPEKPSQTKGKLFHKALEDWLEKGDVPGKDYDRLLPALTHFPQPGTPGLTQERYFALLVDDVVFHGYTDVDVTGPLEVYDLKTTKDFCWAKTTEMLKGDPQNSIYALKQMVEFNGTECNTRWVYMLTEGRRDALPSDCPWTFDEAFTVVSGWLPFARAMVLSHREKKKALDLAFNASHCGAYGGCHYQSVCKISGRQRLSALFRQEKLEANRRETVGMTLQEKIAADLKAKGQVMPPTGGVVPVQKSAAPATATPTAPKPAPTVATKPAATTTTPAATASNVVPKQTLAEKMAAAKKPSLAEVAKSMAENKPLALAKGINPPDASPDPRTATQVDIEEVIAEKVAAEAEAAPAPVATVESTAKIKKSVKKVVTETPAETNQAGIGFFLLVDALVEKGVPLKRVDDLIRPVREELETTTKCGDYRLIDYNKGPAMLAAGLRETFQANKPSGVFVVDSRFVDAPIMQVLTEFADNIVRGVR